MHHLTSIKTNVILYMLLLAKSVMMHILSSSSKQKLILIEIGSYIGLNTFFRFKKDK